MLKQMKNRAPGWRAGMAVLCCVLCWATSGTVAGQVNTETFRIGEPEPGFRGALQGDLSLTKGNVDLVQAGADATGYYHAGIHTPLLAAQAGYGEQGGERFVERAFTHGRWTAMWWPRLGTELFGQLQFDAFVRLKFRALGGAGLRAIAVSEDWIEVAVGAGYMLEREVLNIAAGNRHPRTTVFHRGTSYATVKVALADHLTLTNVAYVQPRFVDPSDLRVLDDLQLAVKVTELLSLTNTLSYRLDTRPPDGIARFDVSLRLGLRLELGDSP